MIQNSKSVSRSQLPIIGDIPLLGSLASNKDNAIVKTELIILIRPHVIRNLDEARYHHRRVSPLHGDRGTLSAGAATQTGRDRAKDTGVMPIFRYRAYGPDGALAEGTIDAVSPDAASDLLWARGLSPYQMRATDEVRHQMVEPRHQLRKRQGARRSAGVHPRVLDAECGGYPARQRIADHEDAGVVAAPAHAGRGAAGGHPQWRGAVRRHAEAVEGVSAGLHCRRPRRRNRRTAGKRPCRTGGAAGAARGNPPARPFGADLSLDAGGAEYRHACHHPRRPDPVDRADLHAKRKAGAGEPPVHA